MISLGFKTQLQKLNREQLWAVEAIDGPVMVVAGPGTGKTQILTLRIANILLKTDAAPENILALTFTESAAANMRRRLVGLIGSAGYYVDVSTFHGFCNRLINHYPENFERIIGSKNINSAGQIALIRGIIENTRLKHLKPFGDKFYYAADILSAVKKIKNEGLGPNEFKKKLTAEKLPVARAYDRMLVLPSDKTLHRRGEFFIVYQKYQKELVRRKLYDFDDMILETISALQQNQDFLLDLQEKYQYILVDEHQDTNGAQNKVLGLLAGYDPAPNLFVVGDEKQAIFRFQGANLENFLYFKKKFPAAKMIELKSNYRSTQNILDASDYLIRHNVAVLSVSVLKAATQPTGRKIKIVAAAAADEESFFVAHKIKELIKSGSAPEKIALIYRENKDAAPLAETLERHGINFAVESDENILENADIKKLNSLLAAIHNFPVTEHLAPALHLDFLNLDPLEIYGWLESKKESPRVLGAMQKIGQWKKLSFNLSFPKFFETVIKDSGFLKNIISQADYADRIKRLNALFNEIKKSARENHNYSLKDYLNHLVVLKEHNLPLQTKITTSANCVRLMTAHRAKGLEFETVFITGAHNGHWGNKRKPDYFGLAELISAPGDLDKNEDERRLFYMALTRAKKNVFITYAQTSAEGREQVPCQFINEIRTDLKEELTCPQLSRSDLYHKKFIKSSIPMRLKPEKDFIKDLFIKRGLSPTSLNNYLKCPWQFFYVNLLRIPQTPNRHQIYGLAKHYALQSFFNAPKPNQRLLTGKFAENLKRHPLIPTDYQTLRQKGQKSLMAYHNFYKNQWNYNTVNEFKISGVDFSVGKEKIRLNGKLDKLEFQDPRSKINVTVVDYKTAKPQSRNWILGKTKNSTGDYFRQLVFYKLLLDALPRSKYRMELGVIDFTEPLDSPRLNSGQAARGKPVFKKESFEVSKADLADLSDIIKKTADEIINLKFWNTRCSQKDCEYCGLRELMPKI